MVSARIWSAIIERPHASNIRPEKTLQHLQGPAMFSPLQSV
jgi:hypothetical protein